MDIESAISFLKQNLVVVIVPGILAVVFGGMFIAWLLKLRRTLHVAKNGVAGTAVVKGLRQTGASKNDVPKVAMLLEVTLPGIPLYTIEKKAYIPMIYYPRIRPGMTIDVVADPQRTHDANYLGVQFRDGV